MKYTIGVDLGSTTTKAVVLSEDAVVLGRGITNSRSNYEVACQVAMGDAAAQHRAVCAEHHRLGRGRPEIDADGVVHDAGRFCSIIWKYDSSRFLILAAEK